MKKGGFQFLFQFLHVLTALSHALCSIVDYGYMIVYFGNFVNTFLLTLVTFFAIINSQGGDMMNERLKVLRKSLGLTQEELGNQLGVTKAAISRLEAGDRCITEQMLKSICREFNIDEIWLRTGEGEMFIQPDEEFVYLSAQVASGDDNDLKEITKMLWTLDVDELKALKSVIKKIKENPNF